MDLHRALREANDYRVYRLRDGKERMSPLVEIGGEADLPDHDNLFAFLPVHLKGLPPELFG
jgi:hypothetical protein